MGRLAGKVVVVTGAARGQGAAEVALLVTEGARVVATDVLDDLGSAVVSGLAGGAGTQARYQHLDVASPADWDAVARLAADAYGVVHGLVNNAAIRGRDRLPNVPLDAWRRAFDVNVTGPLLGIQALVPLMANGGSLLNVCRVGGATRG